MFRLLLIIISYHRYNGISYLFCPAFWLAKEILFGSLRVIGSFLSRGLCSGAVTWCRQGEEGLGVVAGSNCSWVGCAGVTFTALLIEPIFRSMGSSEEKGESFSEEISVLFYSKTDCCFCTRQYNSEASPNHLFLLPWV